MRGLEPPHREAPDPKSGVSTNFTTSALKYLFKKTKKKIQLIGTTKILIYQKWHAWHDSNVRPMP